MRSILLGVIALALASCSPAVQAPITDHVAWCAVVETDGVLLRGPDGKFYAYVMDDHGLIWKQGEFVPCRNLHRAVNI